MLINTNQNCFFNYDKIGRYYHPSTMVICKSALWFEFTLIFKKKIALGTGSQHLLNVRLAFLYIDTFPRRTGNIVIVFCKAGYIVIVFLEGWLYGDTFPRRTGFILRLFPKAPTDCMGWPPPPDNVHKIVYIYMYIFLSIIK